MSDTESVQEKPLVQSLERVEAISTTHSLKTALVIVSILVAGTISGWALARMSSLGGGEIVNGPLKSPDEVAQTGVKVGDVVGVPDEKTFRDAAEGVLVAGGADGEGSHHILRPGGPSQNVYVTSSIVDLSIFEGHKVKIWGETFAAQRAGWLMDVGRVQILELNSSPPFEEDLPTKPEE